MNQNEILAYIEPVYLFCVKRVGRAEAEDLASEILLHVLSGMSLYEIHSLHAWVWRVARNRYARWCNARKFAENSERMPANAFIQLSTGYNSPPDFLSLAEEQQEAFICLHTLSAQYRNILVDYYLSELTATEIAKKHNLPESTVKWRLHAGKSKLKERIGNTKMKIYNRINWETTSCNGAMDTSAYLSGQVARAVCTAAYKNPLTEEEISLKTGLPTLYLEDALPQLLYGDALVKTGGKYATNFIIFHRSNISAMEKEFAPFVDCLASEFARLLEKNTNAFANESFYGHDFGRARLAWIGLPFTLRQMVRKQLAALNMASGPYPPRQDGGYGWFIVEEAEDSRDTGSPYAGGCNGTNETEGNIYYYHVNKYFNSEIYHNGGTRWLAANKIVQASTGGKLPGGLLPQQDILRLLEKNLLVKKQGAFYLNFPSFSQKNFSSFTQLFSISGTEGESQLAPLVQRIHSSFLSFVPTRLSGQVNQWVSCFVQRINGYILDALVARGCIEAPGEAPFVNGVFFLEGPGASV